jgi:hypothetical protein
MKLRLGSLRWLESLRCHPERQRRTPSPLQSFPTLWRLFGYMAADPLPSGRDASSTAPNISTFPGFFASAQDDRQKDGVPATHFLRATLLCPGLRCLGLIGLGLTAMLPVGCRNRAEKSGQAEQTQEKQPAAQITVENGQTLITLDAPTQQRLGIVVTTLSSSVTRAQAAYPALVLSAQSLAAFRNTYVAAEAQLQKARIQAAVEGKEYERLKTLAAGENVSQKSLQAAEATVQSDETDVGAGEQQLKLQTISLRQEWGDVVSGWAAVNSPQLQRILDRSEALVQLTLPAAAGIAPPQSIVLESPGVGRMQASFVSPYPKLDPRIQGRSFLYLASGRGASSSHFGGRIELPSGLNLMAHLPLGAALKGAVIPASAVVWSEGKAWVYSEVGDGRFSRSPLTTDVPVEGGFFASQGFSPGGKIVSVGAQALLSEELLLHSRGGGDED